MKKKIVSAILAFISIGFIWGGYKTSEVQAEAPEGQVSRGRLETTDVVFDSRDFEEIESAISLGRKEIYDSAYSKGYAEGLANQPTLNANVTYVFHHHDTGNGDPTEISFTAEEVEDGTKDAWFEAHPVPEKMSSAVGDYTKQNTHQERYISGYNHHHDPVGPGTWECVDPEIGSYNWTGSWRDWDEPIYSTRTVSDGYVPACGHDEGSVVRVIIDIN